MIPLLLATWAYFSLPATCDSTVVTADGRDSVVTSYPLTDLAEVYLFARPCEAQWPTLIAAKNVTGREGQRDSLVFSWVDSCSTVLELYVTTRRATQARSLPSNVVNWPTWRWTGSEWRRR